MSDEDIKPRSKRRGLLSALASNLGKVGKKQNDRERTSAHLYKKFSDLAAEHNRHCEPNHRVQISPQYSSEDAEEGSADQSDFTRFLAYTPFWALSVKSSWTSLACFLIPTTELLRIDSAEGPTTRKLDLRGRLRDHQLCWSMDGNEIDERDLDLLLKSLFKDMLINSRRNKNNPAAGLHLSIDGEPSLARSVRALVGEKQLLSQKVVDQQEETQARIARELHDAVISDLMLLKRSLSNNSRLTDGEIEKVLDKVCEQLYDICESLTPRDLKDWGLKTVVAGLAEGFSKRSGLPCSFYCPAELPHLPDEVALHLYRIVQESLVNIEKYAKAHSVKLAIVVSNGIIRTSIEDDGIGFERGREIQPKDRGGRGSGTMRERVELINIFYPARIMITSIPEKGTKICVEIKFAESAGQSS